MQQPSPPADTQHASAHPSRSDPRWAVICWLGRHQRLGGRRACGIKATASPSGTPHHPPPVHQPPRCQEVPQELEPSRVCVATVSDGTALAAASTPNPMLGSGPLRAPTGAAAAGEGAGCRVGGAPPAPNCPGVWDPLLCPGLPLQWSPDSGTPEPPTHPRPESSPHRVSRLKERGPAHPGVGGEQCLSCIHTRVHSHTRVHMHAEGSSTCAGRRAWLSTHTCLGFRLAPAAPRPVGQQLRADLWRGGSLTGPRG